MFGDKKIYGVDIVYCIIFVIYRKQLDHVFPTITFMNIRHEVKFSFHLMSRINNTALFFNSSCISIIVARNSTNQTPCGLVLSGSQLSCSAIRSPYESSPVFNHVVIFTTQCLRFNENANFVYLRQALVV